jgi:hypothetical protein
MNCLRLTILLLACAGLGLHAQPGALAPSFNPIDKGTQDAWANGDIMAIAIQPDGKPLVGGAFTTYAGMSRHHIARLNADGSLDTSFKVGSGVYVICARTANRVAVGRAVVIR